MDHLLTGFSWHLSCVIVESPIDLPYGGYNFAHFHWLKAKKRKRENKFNTSLDNVKERTAADHRAAGSGK
jgi:hypothetical protein